jgi:hypothetical protein
MVVLVFIWKRCYVSADEEPKDKKERKAMCLLQKVEVTGE